MTEAKWVECRSLGYTRQQQGGIEHRVRPGDETRTVCGRKIRFGFGWVPCDKPMGKQWMCQRCAPKP